MAHPSASGVRQATPPIPALAAYRDIIRQIPIPIHAHHAARSTQPVSPATVQTHARHAYRTTRAPSANFAILDIKEQAARVASLGISLILGLLVHPAASFLIASSAKAQQVAPSAILATRLPSAKLAHSDTTSPPPQRPPYAQSAP